VICRQGQGMVVATHDCYTLFVWQFCDIDRSGLLLGVTLAKLENENDAQIKKSVKSSFFLKKKFCPT